ncbi:hypothetical protein BJ322DRAFT_240621 [Thelephora terrestris]|uniref:F-box domain-containing protein n=1 Tax=Thelephora terrestris TaxID=56493 RepID=A0A9P6H977_9AGAM|nr:hypothetical protein BJ322DRAFT_240621 [Thelephora terrestris]
MVKFFRTLSRRTRSLVCKSKGRKVTAGTEKQPDDSSVVHHEHAALPQELVDHIMEMLQDDLQALKACSLTCKAMFASTRHLIHRTLRLTVHNEKSVLARAKHLRHRKCDHDEVGLRLLTCKKERQLLQYTQQVCISMPQAFTPDTLQPHLHHFQSLDRVHTLTIEHFDSIPWAHDHKTYFLHFYPTLTSLTLTHAINHYRLLLQFAFQFPNLENLCIEELVNGERSRSELYVPTVIDQSPPLCGHLRLVGVDTAVPWPVDLTLELPNGINFRSVELEAFFGSRAQHVLNACAGTLESLTIVPQGTGYLQLHNLRFTKIPGLRQLTLRMSFPQLSALALELLPRSMSTISSSMFHEFVLEISRIPADFCGSYSLYWGEWERIDRFLETRFASRQNFRLVIRTSELCDQETFEKYAKETFPFMAGRGCIRFESSNSIEKYWS